MPVQRTAKKWGRSEHRKQERDEKAKKAVFGGVCVCVCVRVSGRRNML